MSTQATVHQTKWWSGGKSPFNLEYGKLMMWYFLMSDAFTFGAFLISYGSIRFSQNFWPDPNVVFNAFPGAGHANLPLAFVSVMTFILIISSVTMVLAVHAGHKGDKAGCDKMDGLDNYWRTCLSWLPGMGVASPYYRRTCSIGRW